MGSTLSAKQASLKLIERLNENVTYEDIMYELLLLQKVEQGLQDVKEGRTTPHDNVDYSIKIQIQNFWHGP